MIKYFLSIVLFASTAFGGLPPTTSRLSTDSSNVTTFNYQFPNFTGTHTGTTVSLGVNSIAGGGTNNGSLGVTAGGVIYTDGTKLMNTGAGTTGQALFSNGASAPSWGSVLTNPMTTGGDLIYGGASGVPTRLANGTAGQYLVSAGGTSPPVWTSFVAPTVQQFSSGSGTYTTPTSPRVPIYIKVRMVGGGGGGGGSGSGGSPGAGGNGGNTSFNSIVANGGGQGAAASTNQNGANGGTGGSGGAGTATLRSAGQGGTAGGVGITGAANGTGGAGGGSLLGGGGRGVQAAGAGATGVKGGGGAGAGPASGGLGGPGGGGAGEYVELVITNPTTSYSYSVGAAGTGGTAGTGGSAGGDGGAGFIEVTEYYQ